MIQIFVRQRFSVRRKSGDRSGFTIVAPTLAEAMAELRQWHKADVATGTPTFVQAEVFDREQFMADPLNARPFRIIKKI